MAPKTLELDGLTSFRSHPKLSFRFVLTLKGNKLNVWLENRKSKKQWQSEFLGLDDFVTSENAIPSAKLGEYAECFKAALEDTDEKATAPVERELLDEDGKLKLKFVVHIKVFSASWSPAYSLTLKPVAIERIDIAESRLFDVEQEVERIAHGRKLSPMVTQLVVASASTSYQAVTWKPTSSECFAVVEDTKVRALSAGIYLVAMHISHAVTGYSYYIQLLKDGQEVFRSTVPNCQGNNGFVSATWIVQLKKDETLSLVGYGFSIQFGSKMVITRLGG